MDTLTHALSGALLARALTPSSPGGPTPRTERWFGPRIPLAQAITVGFVAAALPDADFVLQAVSEIAYLRGHRGVTHSLVLLPLWSLLIGSLFAMIFRRHRAWKRYSWLTAAAIAFHIAGDLITQFGTMIYAPFSDQRVGLGSTFIIDLVVSGILVAGLAVSAIFRGSRMPAVGALLLLPLWIGVSLTGRDEAIAAGRTYAEQRQLRGAVVDAAPRPASPFNWTVIVDDGARFHTADVNTRRTERVVATADDHFIRRYGAPYLPIAEAEWRVQPKFGSDDSAELASEAWREPEFEFFRWFAMFPALDHLEKTPEATCAWFRDLRFDIPGRVATPFRYGLCRNGDAGKWRIYTLGPGDRRVPLT